MARGLIHPLAGGRRIRPTSPSCRSARQLKPGRPSTYQAEDAVQTNRASSAGEGGRQPGSGAAKGGLAPALTRLHQLIGRALERTAALWPDVEQAYRFVHAVAH